MSLGDTDRRKNYWNDNYLNYWKSKVSEAESDAAGSTLAPSDKKVPSAAIYGPIFDRLNPGRVLDVGCAWGRLFPMYLERDLQVVGVDISSAMIEAAARDWSGKAGILEIIQAEAESLPFESETIENVVCVAVFDATRQEEALAEFIRVLKRGGILVLTGKNTRYHEDDQEAFAAEAGARSKGHPNRFTDYEVMAGQLAAFGHDVLGTWFFKRRGDFADQRYIEVNPKTFYEYLTVIRRGPRLGPAFEPFSSEYSESWMRYRGQGAPSAK